MRKTIERNKKIYSQRITSILQLDKGSVFFYWKGRVALYALLKSIDIGENDEVVMPGLTCVVVPNAVIYLKAKPVYVDVSIETCNPSFENIISAVNERTKVIIVQNTFGLSSDVDRITQWAKRMGIYTIEDCTHGFGGTFKGKPNGSYCDAAIYSTQWNKPFSTGVGGFSIINNELLTNSVQQVNKGLISPTVLESLQLKVLIVAYKILINNSTYWILLSLYRWLSKVGLVIGSSSRNEISRVLMKSNYFKSASGTQYSVGIKNISMLSTYLKHRKINAEKYSQFLKKHGKYYVLESLHRNHSFLKYPILVRDREEFMKKAEKNRIKIGDWFISVLHPAYPPFEHWKLNIKLLPNAKYLSEHLVNLPTDVKDINKVVKFLEGNLSNILNFNELKSLGFNEQKLEG